MYSVIKINVFVRCTCSPCLSTIRTINLSLFFCPLRDFFFFLDFKAVWRLPTCPCEMWRCVHVLNVGAYFELMCIIVLLLCSVFKELGPNSCICISLSVLSGTKERLVKP
jgi:hypothetical protein